MPDPQTQNRQLNEPIPGTDVGTWGTPLNNNFTNLDQAFGGIATIALTNSPVTLSQAQFQCAFLVFTGALSANVVITLPTTLGVVAGSTLSAGFFNIQNLTSNTSNFGVSVQTNIGGTQAIGLPPGQPIDVFTDGSNVKFRSLPHNVGEYWDYGGSSVPSWVGACTIPPYLNCDATAFSSTTYPVLATILGGTTLPDSKGRARFTLDQGAGRLTSSGGIDGTTRFAGGGAQLVTISSANLPATAFSFTDPGHSHTVQNTNSPGGGLGYTGGVSNINATTQTSTSVTGITATFGSTTPSAIQTLPPGYVGGITMIRAA